MTTLENLRDAIRDNYLADEATVLRRMTAEADISATTRKRVGQQAKQLVKNIRGDDEPGLMEVFLAEYGLSTDEGVALMCLAEALLRVPDAETIDDLIEDKIAPSSWGTHLGQSTSSLVNASTWALMLTGKVLDEDQSTGIVGLLHGAIKRLGEPVIRVAVKRAMQEMGNQFVLGETIENAISRGAEMQKKGFTYSYDMLGEAALTARDATAFYEAYEQAIGALAQHARSSDIRENPGISIKLSALHPRYEYGQRDRVMAELTERTLALVLQAKDANMGLNIDAEEADRLDLSLDVIEAVLSDERLAGWDGFGVVVQAYGKRAPLVIDWLHTLATSLDRKIMVRLVKGAYWDTEIKRAQVEGLAGFPVFTQKSATDVAYICCAKKLLGMTDRVYPQFATHNAHSVSAVLELADDREAFEFQRLHGMGETLHRLVMKQSGTRCRIYAPVGAHSDLLAYLVRRLLENGANSSFVNQIVDESVPPEEIVADPFETIAALPNDSASAISKPCDLFQPERENSRGFDLHAIEDVEEIEAARAPYQSHVWTAGPLTAEPASGTSAMRATNPANANDHVGEVVEATPADAEAALSNAREWRDSSPSERTAILNRAADLYEENFGEFFAVLAREAGKTPLDAVAELREAVDFLRYYAQRSAWQQGRCARGVITCISPWNFPLAIFTGQIAAALAAGNGVLAKPAETTPITAYLAVKLLHDAGVPKPCLQLLPGRGSQIGAALVSDPRVKGVAFTGSTATAQAINRSMAQSGDPDAPLIAETGGLNAMIVDSTALPEQAVRDIVASAFQSAGQRCSALRILFLQEDVADTFTDMLFGTMDELRLGDPWQFSTDIGPVIDSAARKVIDDHVDAARKEGRLLKQLDVPSDGTFVGPAVIRVSGMADMEREIFGPVLHLATFKSGDIDSIIADINASRYGLTFGLHTRIDDRVEHLVSNLNVGNIYINRNQIGAIVGSQPFGGEGLSGTGPKAGGPHYVPRFTREMAGDAAEAVPGQETTNNVAVADAQRLIDNVSPTGRHDRVKTFDLPGPTGESNRLSLYPRGTILCLGPTPQAAERQAQIVRSTGCRAALICPGAQGDGSLNGFLKRSILSELTGFDAVVSWGDKADLRECRQALAQRTGRLIPLISERDFAERCFLERHVCVDTTAAGGNASLLASMA